MNKASDMTDPGTGQLRPRLELVALGSDPDAAREVAEATTSIVYLANSETNPKAPFKSLLRAVIADLKLLNSCSDVALHLVYSRQIKRHPVTWEPGTPTPGVVGAFGLRHHPDLTHEETDLHWQSIHAPLALEHHSAMWDYVQLSVVTTLRGPALDGIALCGFPTEEDFKERFFNSSDSERIINKDVSSFADLGRSPRPAVLTEVIY